MNKDDNRADPRGEGRAEALWTFATTIYAREEVSGACLWLQDHCAVDVNVLLTSLWAGAERRIRFDVAAISAIDGDVAAWREEIVVPLRTVRRRMKTGPAPAPDAASERLRNKLKAVEVEAEKLELKLLGSIANRRANAASNAGSGDALARGNARAAIEYYLANYCPSQARESESVRKGIDAALDVLARAATELAAHGQAQSSR